MPLSGPASRFRVTDHVEGQRTTFVTALPLARLTVERFFSDDRRHITHRVAFSGLLAFVFAGLLGPGFRAALPTTMQRLADLSEGRP